jgi:hypothetical protein
MTAMTYESAQHTLPPRPSSLRRYWRETALLIGRGMRTIPRVPERLSDVTIQPIVFTLLFLYVFGSAIHIPGMSYQNYLLPGLLGQSLAFGVIGSGVATANDFTSGVIDRFRSLPVTRLSVITAQVIGQMLEQVIDRRPRHRARLAAASVGGRRIRAGRPDPARLVRLHLVRRTARDGDPLLRRDAGRRLRDRVSAVLPGRHVRADPGDEDRPAGDR